MKKLFLAIVLVIVILATTGCSNSKIIGIPDGYINKEEHFDKEGIQDFTDYAKYIYGSEDVITGNKEYKKIEYNDIQNVVGYFEDFSGWMKAADRLSEYDFDMRIISEGDYYKVKTKEGQIIGNSEHQYRKYDNYSVYFFDVETLTLYYIHNNI